MSKSTSEVNQEQLISWLIVINGQLLGIGPPKELKFQQTNWIIRVCIEQDLMVHIVFFFWNFKFLFLEVNYSCQPQKIKLLTKNSRIQRNHHWYGCHVLLYNCSVMWYNGQRLRHIYLHISGPTSCHCHRTWDRVMNIDMN